MNKVIILVDSFKSSISSKQIGNLGKNIFQKEIPNLEVKSSCIADGGEGTVDFFINEMGYEKRMVKTVNAFLEEITTYYAVKDDKAVFDVASVVGFLVNNKLDVMNATSYGVGLVLKKIIDEGYKNIYLGLGGSITNDGGSGILEALGTKFYYQNELIFVHQNGHCVINKADFSATLELFKNIKITAICDVTNPLLGDFGATKIFSPQKGASSNDVLIMEKWMEKYATLFNVDNTYPGCGAAGGIGYMVYLLNGSLEKGIDVILKELNIEKDLNPNTLVITGEGKLDQTSFYGKVVGKLCDLQKKYHHKMIIICGSSIIDNLEYPIYPLHQTVPENYKETVEEDLERTFRTIINDYQNGLI